MKYTYSELLRRLADIPRKGWAEHQVKDLIDSLWRDPDEIINRRISGGFLIWQTGLTFTISPTEYRIGKKFKLDSHIVTLDAADPDYTRIDVVAVNYLGEYEVIKGIPAEYPLKPNINPKTQLELTFVEIPALATEPANMVEGQIYNEHIAGEWTPSVVGTTANWESTTTPSKGSKCAAIGALTNGDQLIFTAPEDYRDSDWATLSFDLRLPNTSSRGHFIEAYFTYNGRSRSKLVPAQFSRSVTGWQTVVFAMPDFEVRNTLFNGLVLRWSNQNGATYAGIEIDNVRLQKGIDLPGTTDNYVTGASWDEATSTLTLHRTGGLGDITVTITGAGGGADGREVEMSVSGGYIVWRYVGETVWNNLVELATLVGPPGADGADGDDGTSTYTYVAYASTNTGTGFSLTPTDLLKYRAEIHVTSPLTPPTSTDFAGATWVKYIGDDGADGTGGGGSTVIRDETVEVYIDFEDAVPFTYTCPFDLRFTELEYEGSEPTLSVALNTDLSQYDDVTITPAGAGLVILKGKVAASFMWEVYIDFEIAGEETYKCPYALKFTSMEHEQANAPTLDVALNTDMAKYDVLTINADAPGLVTLKGTLL